MTSFNHDTYISPFTWRYGSSQMREIYSERHKRILLRRIWIALATAQMEAGLVTQKQVEELLAHKTDIDVDRATEIENIIHHDLMAEIKTYAEQCPSAAAIIHLGATSMDVLDNMDAMRLKEALTIIIDKSKELLSLFVDKMSEYKDMPCMAFTHIQPAEPTTVGYRIAQSAQDLIDDIKDLERVKDNIKGKGMKGAVGTAASYCELLKNTKLNATQMEDKVMSKLNLKAFSAATQVYTRKQDLRVVNALSSLSCTLYKFFIDFRILQSPPIGEWSEPFGKNQVGSSAMPFKRNPINSEKIDSLCRFVSSQPNTVWQNSAQTLLERTLDDSANRRVTLPSSFLATDEILITAIKVVKNMNIHKTAIERNMKTYGIFAASERLLMELGRNGANRQEMHEVIREHSLKAWKEVQEGKANTLKNDLINDKVILKYVSKEKADELLNADEYIGDAPLRTSMIINEAKQIL
ncbi:MAG: adenylosuccinate lyase [Sphaerochaetaceae bacterium]|nr:adenylosuccinate lyase [Sphaerochaetaceae bacterium]MDC7237460.1 adenylosuccinate lyase [Sphaerochaetaceae bacterium]MDC7242994.1 adenylosuccinate lyase [Sphaerochaetaceae bacterium]MDC7248558.1 adenylosuccinate lyase [Sphaerochaetaceae bacterium]